MAEVKLQSDDFRRILRAVPHLARFPAKQMRLDFDSETDVLYISFRCPQRATVSETRKDGIIVHRRGKQIVGLTILDASTR